MGPCYNRIIKNRENFVKQSSHQDHISQRRPAIAIHVEASNSRHFHDDWAAIIHGQVMTRSLPLHTCNYSQAMTRPLQSLNCMLTCMSINGTVSGEGQTHGTMIVMTYREHN